MCKKDNHKEVFFALLRAGLWGNEACLLQYGKYDLSRVSRWSASQSVAGLVTAGMELVQDKKVPKDQVLPLVVQTMQIEQRNRAMNQFICKTVGKMRENGIYTLLVKGQGIAQCYERPLWRQSGDIDFLLSEKNYRKAKDFLLPLSSNRKNEERYSQHLGISIDSWYVEIHGSMRTGLSRRIDKMVDEVQKDTLNLGQVRTWHNEEVDVF